MSDEKENEKQQEIVIMYQDGQQIPVLADALGLYEPFPTEAEEAQRYQMRNEPLA